jgi:HPt (histidine-containing phosphotransfer) domain-containing protein
MLNHNSNLLNLNSQAPKNGTHPMKDAVKKPQAFHPAVVEVCKEIAGNFYENVALEDDHFFKMYPNQKFFIQTEWPRFFWAAAHSIDGVAQGKSRARMQQQGMSFEQCLRAEADAREVMEMQASIPMEGDGQMVQTKKFYN